MKTLILIAAIQMCAWYLKVPPDFSQRMNGRASAINPVIVYKDAVSKEGDTVCAPWYMDYFPSAFDSIAIDSVYLCDYDF